MGASFTSILASSWVSHFARNRSGRAQPALLAQLQIACWEERPCCCAEMQLHAPPLQRDKAHRPVHCILGGKLQLRQQVAAIQGAAGRDSQGCDCPSQPVEDEVQGLPCCALQAATPSPSPRR